MVNNLKRLMDRHCTSIIRLIKQDALKTKRKHFVSLFVFVSKKLTLLLNNASLTITQCSTKQIFLCNSRFFCSS